MPNKENMNEKILRLAEYFRRYTDENHHVTTDDIRTYLGDEGLDKRTLDGYLHSLENSGMVISAKRGSRGYSYYLENPAFTASDLRLLTDCVQSSKFITEKRTLSLIRKLSSLATVYDEQNLKKEIHVSNRIKSESESVYGNVDEIYSAISVNHTLSFRYLEYTTQKTKVYKHSGALYTCSPIGVIYDSENYYMYALDHKDETAKHFRVDKMVIKSINPEKRHGIEEFKKTDMSAYSRSVFGMFTGTMTTVRLRLKNHLAGAVIDLFGRDTILAPDGAEHFTATVKVSLSPHFLGWIFALGQDAEILYPDTLRREMAEAAKAVYERYS